MFGFPIYASRLTSDPQSELIVVYDHEQTFSMQNEHIEDYYQVGSNETSREIILMGVDVQGAETGQVVSFTTADIPTLYKVQDVKISKETKLIYVLGESVHSRGQAHHIYILNKPLAKDLNSRNPAQRGGLIFVLDTNSEQPKSNPLLQSRSLNIYLPSNL